MRNVGSSVQANELELAQDVYKQMLEEGCTPNLVTYNILIDVYTKKGAWDEAVKILDTLERQVRDVCTTVSCTHEAVHGINKLVHMRRAFKLRSGRTTL